MLTLAIATIVVLVGAALVLLLWPEGQADAESPDEAPADAERIEDVAEPQRAEQ